MWGMKFSLATYKKDSEIEECRNLAVFNSLFAGILPTFVITHRDCVRLGRKLLPVRIVVTRLW